MIDDFTKAEACEKDGTPIEVEVIEPKNIHKTNEQIGKEIFQQYKEDLNKILHK